MPARFQPISAGRSSRISHAARWQTPSCRPLLPTVRRHHSQKLQSAVATAVGAGKSGRKSSTSMKSAAQLTISSLAGLASGLRKTGSRVSMMEHALWDSLGGTIEVYATAAAWASGSAEGDPGPERA